MNFFRILLSPFAFLYCWITRFRNHLFDIGYKKSVSFDVPVVSVGNLIVGGAGKTPMVEYLIRTFERKYNICTLSRGYGRKSRGFRLANKEDDPSTIGDEPIQFFEKFNDRITVAVGEERALAIPEILFHKENTNLIILDDAFQHRYVKPGFSILLTEYDRPFFRDFVLPTGLLRESRSGSKRANAIVVTKCPDNLTESERKSFSKSIGKYALNVPVFFATIEYGHMLPENKTLSSDLQVVSLSGIANPGPFEQYLSKRCQLIDSMQFADHHRFTNNDVEKICRRILKYDKGTIVLTTEKDYGRLKPFLPRFSAQGIEINYLPIYCKFLFDGNKFDKLVSDAIIAVQSRVNR